MQNQLLHGLAHKITIGYHSPDKFPDYEPLKFGGEVREEEAPTEADAIILQGFFERMAGGG